MKLLLVGIGTGNPEHLTLQAVRALNAADLIMIPRKGPDKADLADLRRAICIEVVTNPATRVVHFDLPTRDPSAAYLDGVEAWHAAIAGVWTETMAAHAGPSATVALLVWGDPSLFDSTLRIAARLQPAPEISVIPGITAIQALTAAHAMPLNQLASPFTVTTGRQLSASGWPAGVDTLVVMLDGACAFQTLDPQGVSIWWGAYLGMPDEIIRAGPLGEMGPVIAADRSAARTRHGWIMDVYILRR